MVLLHFKRSDHEDFLTELPSSTPVDDALQHIAQIHNKRMQIKRLVSSVEDLAKHGPQKSDAEQAVLEEVESLTLEKDASVSETESEHADPTGQRQGVPPAERAAATLRECAVAATNVIDKKKAENRQQITMEEMKEAIDNIRGAVMIAYPMELPDYDPVRQNLENREDLSGKATSLSTEDFVHIVLSRIERAFTGEIIDPKESSLWWANKELLSGKLLSDYIGRNEKTKVIVKIQKRGGGAPQREPPVDQETQQAMMQFYYRRQEEMKKLEEAKDDNYLNAEWANPRALKSSLMGNNGNIRFR